MKIKLVKQLLWVVNTILVVATVLFALKFFILGGARKEGVRKAEEILGQEALRIAPEGIRRSARFPDATFAAIWKLPMSGLPPVEEVAAGPATGPTRVPPLARDYDLVSTYVDLTDEMKCCAQLFKKDDRKIRHYWMGEKVENAWKVVEVKSDSATFEDVTGGEKVTLEVTRKAAIELGAGGGEKPDVPPRIGGGGEAPPPPEAAPTREAVEIRENFWSVPPEESLWWETYGEQRLEQDVTIQPVKNPETGQPEGLMLKSVSEGSMVKKRGLRRNDIIRSINGTRVASRQEIVSYVKGAGEGLSRYIVEVERDGRIFTITYTVNK